MRCLFKTVYTPKSLPINFKVCRIKFRKVQVFYLSRKITNDNSSAITVFWVSPSFGYPRTLNTSVLGIPSGDTALEIVVDEEKRSVICREAPWKERYSQQFQVSCFACKQLIQPIDLRHARNGVNKKWSTRRLNRSLRSLVSYRVEYSK